MKISVNVFDPKSIDKAIDQLNDYANSLEQKTKVLVDRLTMMGAINVSIAYSRLFYTGPVDISVDVKDLGEGKYAIVASGETVLIAEFGAGLIGYGHPDPQVGGQQMGPGTYPNAKGHWDDENGWWLPREKTGGHGVHTFGNPPTMAMYNTAKDLKQEIRRVAQEVFKSND